MVSLNNSAPTGSAYQKGTAGNDNYIIKEIDLPNDVTGAAHWWFAFGFNVIPVVDDSKTTPLKWQPWLNKLSHDAIDTYWADNPSHDLGFIVDDKVIVLDADSPASLEALRLIEKTYDIQPNLIVMTRKGEHHYFKRGADTYAKQRGYNSDEYPENIDVKTGRSLTEGRSMVILPPSTNKTVAVIEAKSIDDLVEVDQDFIDAVFSHNGEEIPRPPTERELENLASSASVSEAAEILSYIDAAKPYDDWVKICSALHKHFNGSDAGLILCDQWSAQASNYCGFEMLEYKWNSFSADKAGGAGFASVCRYAEKEGADLSAIAKKYVNGVKKKTFDELVSDAQNLPSNAHPDALKAFMTQVVSLSKAEQESIKELLHKNHVCSKTMFKETLKEASREISAQRQQVLHGQRLPLHVPVSTATWLNLDTENRPPSTYDNFERMLQAYGITIRYNVITKKDEVLIPNQSYSLDNQANATYAQIISLCKLNGLSTDTVGNYICMMADKNLYNPVLTWIESKPWDGVSRFNDLANTLTMENLEHNWLRNKLLTRWLLSAIAALTSPVPIMTKGVLVFTGAQNKGKTSWFNHLLPKEMGSLLLEAHQLDPSDKDSVTTAVSHWLVELGELDATFRKADQARLKAFIGKKTDKVRRPYARLDSEYQRRTVFFGSVNEYNYLKDMTGNVRWWTLAVKKIDYQHTVDMQQLWAEMLHWYNKGEQYWLTDEESEALKAINESHMEINPLEERLLSEYDLRHTRTHRLTATDVLMSLGYEKPDKAQANDMARLLRKHFDKPDSRCRYKMPESRHRTNYRNIFDNFVAEEL